MDATPPMERRQHPKMEEKEFMAEYNITNMVDEPPSGYARVDAFFTAKPGVLYAILPRWPDAPIALRGVSGTGAQVTMVGAAGAIASRMSGDGLVVTVPPALRSSVPHSHAYVLKITGVQV